METLLTVFSKCLPCFPDLSTPYVSINNAKYKIIRLLGEGDSRTSIWYLISQITIHSMHLRK